MKIKKITKMSNNKYKIEFTNKDKIITYDDVILKYNLLYKKEIDDALYKLLYNETSDYNLYFKVMKYVLIRIRSLKEITKYMNKLNISNEEQIKIISKLKDNNLINDKKFAEAYIADKINLTTSGPNKIKKDLLNHDIDEKIIDDILTSYSDEIFEDKINKIVQKRTTNPKYSSYILKKKLTNDLLNLGYNLDMVNKVIEAFVFDNSNALEKDYIKFRKRLINKYEGEELKQQIIKKLITKGYKYDEINLFINEI